MSVSVHFAHGARLSFARVSFASSVHFSQKKAYGMGFGHCFLLGDGSNEIPEELRHESGESDEGDVENRWFQPDWERALRIADTILARARELSVETLPKHRYPADTTPEHFAQIVAHRREYDLADFHLPALREHVAFCAEPERRIYCRVSLSY